MSHKIYRISISMAILLFFLVLSILFLTIGIKVNNNKIILHSYIATKNADYQVLLKENNFYEDQVLASGKNYASKSIDKYLLNFEYDFQSDKIKSINYRYNITAQLMGTVSNNNEQEKEIWTKNYILIEDKQNKITQNGFKVKENVDINYDTYNNLAREYENNYDISITSKLKVRFNIYYDIEYENKYIDKGEDYIELDISLTNSVSNVENNYEEITKKENYATNKNYIYYVISGITATIAVVLIIIYKNKRTPEEVYKSKIKNILKSYSELIVTVSNEPNVENYTVMKINSLEDIIDLAEQNKINIIHYESIKDKENRFYVFVDKFVYIYQVSI